MRHFPNSRRQASYFTYFTKLYLLSILILFFFTWVAVVSPVSECIDNYTEYHKQQLQITWGLTQSRGQAPPHLINLQLELWLRYIICHNCHLYVTQVTTRSGGQSGPLISKFMSECWFPALGSGSVFYGISSWRQHVNRKIKRGQIWRHDDDIEKSNRQTYRLCDHGMLVLQLLSQLINAQNERKWIF